ncbi:predicted protein [Histoplasma capsulatum H143]|uniref:Uncharacterized protein n=1 Tax=Ajellomyces capsulatus (strain H143) TaxID=544712 RepID=C6H3A0_AJECH|nr:predicted protein [Histoplasma capsulatum H143]
MARGITMLALPTLPPKPRVNDSPAAAGTWGSDDEEQIYVNLAARAKSPIHESNRDASDNTHTSWRLPVFQANLLLPSPSPQSRSTVHFKSSFLLLKTPKTPQTIDGILH